MTSVLVIDNYDSFTYNLVQYLGELGAERGRGAQRRWPELLERAPDRVVVSPGPCTPEEAGLSKRGDPRATARRGVPVLGVCLGHQALAPAYGGRWCAASRCTARPPRSSTTAGRSSTASNPRSWSAATTRWSSTPSCRTSSRCPRRSGDVIMGLRHRELPVEGVQFHPESVLTPHGKELLRNFLA